jgi:hypothetical protein
MRPHVCEHERARVVDQQSQDAATARQLADRGVGGRVEAAREEPLKSAALRIEHSDRRVARAGQLPGRLEQPLQHDLHVELDQQRAAGLEETLGALRVEPVRAGRGHPSTTIVTTTAVRIPQAGRALRRDARRSVPAGESPSTSPPRPLVDCPRRCRAGGPN